MSKSHDGHLGAVYDARSVDDIARVYDDWASTYDAYMGSVGYRHPSITLALLARHAPAGPGPVLDAGCGTGTLGEWLVIAGYSHVEALDISERMLETAAKRGCYKALHRAALGTRLPFADSHFAAVISAGVFTTGHVGVEGVADLLRISRPGGVIVLTIKDALWHSGFSTYLTALEAEGRIARLEETQPYISMPGDPATTAGRALALRVSA
jgi:predicted TPR repeat methyltransferase